MLNLIQNQSNLVIRLLRRGHIRYPVYDIVVINRKKRRDNKHYLERVGFINPNASERLIFIDSVRLTYWVNCGVKINKAVYKYISFLAF